MTAETVEPSELDRLLAEGQDVTFADGTVARLVLNARAMAAIENTYGSLDDYFAALRAATGGKLYHHLVFTFRICFGFNENKAWDLVDTKHTAQYIKAIGAAIKEALPDLTEDEKQEAAEGELGNGSTAPGQSPGADSSTSPSSSGMSIPSDSGA